MRRGLVCCNREKTLQCRKFFFFVCMRIDFLTTSYPTFHIGLQVPVQILGNPIYWKRPEHFLFLKHNSRQLSSVNLLISVNPVSKVSLFDIDKFFNIEECLLKVFFAFLPGPIRRIFFFGQRNNYYFDTIISLFFSFVNGF